MSAPLPEEEIVERLATLATLKGKDLPVRTQVAYAEVLARFPGDLVATAIERAALDPDPFIPSVGALVAGAVAACPGVPDAEEAWRRAKRLLARYQPQTRPDPGSSGDPAVDQALADLGGAATIAWEDEEGEGYRKREFLARFAIHSRTPDYLAWALTTAGRVPDPIVSGLEGHAAALRPPSPRGAILTGATLAPALPEPPFRGTPEEAAKNRARLAALAGAALAAKRLPSTTTSTNTTEEPDA